MKFYLRLPDGGEIKFEKEPMKPERFEAICWLIGIALVGHGMLEFFSIAVGR